MKEKKSFISQKFKRNLIMVLSVIGFLFLQLVVIVFSAIGMSYFNGVFMAIQFGLCLIMVKTDYKIGYRTSLILSFISVLFLSRNIMATGDVTPIPGLFNTVIYLFSLSLLKRQFAIRDKEAITDLLTGLLNRRGLFKLLEEKKSRKRPFKVIYVSIDNFKLINDNYGRIYGDTLLVESAKKMSEVVGKKGTITRIGGDEFVVIVDDDENAEELANKILNKLNRRFVTDIDSVELASYIRSYAGVAAFPNDTDDYDTLITYADIAMYEAINSNSPKACVFTMSMNDALKRQVELEKIIKEGLEKKQFYLAYQPQYAFMGKQLTGFEALLRITTPDGQSISPGEIIPVAEKSDLILAIDEYVLRRSISELGALVNASSNDLTVSVNVSAKNLENPDFADGVIWMLNSSGISAKHLEIEITEYCFVQAVEVTLDNIRKLHDFGINVAIDDFGTGYTSLSYLSKLSIDMLKIDKSLIDDVTKEKKNCDFVKAVISIGHLMDCKVLAEGVEDEQQITLLKRLGCDYVQGYVWGKPMLYADALELAKQF